MSAVKFSELFIEVHVPLQFIDDMTSCVFFFLFHLLQEKEEREANEGAGVYGSTQGRVLMGK